MSNIQQVSPYGSVSASQIPDGVQPVWGSKGERITAYSEVTAIPGTMIAPPSGIPYKPKALLCAWNDYGCKAPRFGTTELCFGHFQRFLKGRTGELKGDELTRIEFYRKEYEEIERKRVEDKKAAKEELIAQHLAETKTPEVNDES
jgi:hypothetical protein